MPISKNNFSHVTNFELEGVDVTFITVDFINSMAAETGDVSSGSAVAGLEATRNLILARANILAEGPLTDTNTQKTYVVRTDSVNLSATFGTTFLAELQTNIRALPAAVVTADVSSATVTGTKLGILTAAAIAL